MIVWTEPSEDWPVFFLRTEPDPEDAADELKATYPKSSMEIPDELYARYREAARAWTAVQAELKNHAGQQGVYS